MYKYATQNITEKMAKACMKSQAISTKQSVEIAKWLKGKRVAEAVTLLEGVIEKKVAVPFTRFNWDVGHKPGIGPGRYPQKAAKQFIALLKLAKANAIDQSLDGDNLVVFNIVAQKAAKQFKPSRVRGQKAKSTHIEAVVMEVEAKAPTKAKRVAKVATQEKPEGTAKPAQAATADAAEKPKAAPKKTASVSKEPKAKVAAEVSQ